MKLLFSITIVLIAGLALVWDTSASLDVQDSGTFSAKRDTPFGQRLYESDTYSFSLLYPMGLQVSETVEGAGASTIVFQDARSGKGFQIFVVPYKEPQVSPERFARDIPSGVIEAMRDITIDGATAASFYSQHTLLGETAEIWFVHDGFLYEVTTLAPLDDWLSEIMLTWRFE